MKGSRQLLSCELKMLILTSPYLYLVARKWFFGILGWVATVNCLKSWSQWISPEPGTSQPWDTWRPRI